MLSLRTQVVGCQTSPEDQVGPMSKLKLTLACWDYDRTRPLIDGRVQAEGVGLNIKVMRPRDLSQDAGEERVRRF